MSVCVWRRKILIKGKGLETGQGRRETFLPKTRVFPRSAYRSILHKALKRPYSVCSLCKISLASVDDLFHPDGPIELKPQSVKYSYGRQKPPRSSHRGPVRNGDGFPIEIVTRTLAYLRYSGFVQIPGEK